VGVAALLIDRVMTCAVVLLPAGLRGVGFSLPEEESRWATPASFQHDAAEHPSATLYGVCSVHLAHVR
jgi:hypothetical protein